MKIFKNVERLTDCIANTHISPTQILQLTYYYSFFLTSSHVPGIHFWTKWIRGIYRTSKCSQRPLVYCREVHLMNRWHNAASPSVPPIHTHLPRIWLWHLASEGGFTRTPTPEDANNELTIFLLWNCSSSCVSYTTVTQTWNLGVIPDICSKQGVSILSPKYL